MAPSPLPRLRRICLALPQAVEVEAWGTSTFRCGKIFAMFSHADDTVHSGGRPGVWLKAAPGNQQLMVRDRPDRFFAPPYVGTAGWVGVRLDQDPPWDEIALLVEDSWRLIAPKKLLKAHDEGGAIPVVRSVSRSQASREASTSAAKKKPAKGSVRRLEKKPAKKSAKKSVRKFAKNPTNRSATKPTARKK